MLLFAGILTVMLLAGVIWWAVMSDVEVRP